MKENNLIPMKITDTLRENYMPYAMSVIVSRAITEIDGFKPSHRKLLYTMYKMGLIKGNRVKSADVVGQTMRLNPHGDMAIYETLVRLTRGNMSLLHPLIDSKGNFGRVYSKDMAFAASRYTEVKLDNICELIFRNIDKNAVDFIDNYNGTMQEPLLLPTVYPNVLVSANQGIAVGMASNICSFNLKEVCDTTIELIKNPNHDILSTLKAPDFPTGGELIYDEATLRKIYKTGQGSFKVRGKYTYDKKNNCIDVTEIPYTTTIEAIIDKIITLVKTNKLREINDVRDETDLKGLKITIDLKKGTDVEKLMHKLYKMTPLEDSFSCNFNLLINGRPQLLGVGSILEEWLIFRTSCITRETVYEIDKKEKKLNLLNGLSKILLDIDKAIKIIRDTEQEKDVIPNLMTGFSINEEQAEYIAEIKLRNLNKEYLLNRISEKDALEKSIADLKKLLESDKLLKKQIIKELKEVSKKYGTDRQTTIIHPDDIKTFEDEQFIDDFDLTLFLTNDGYIKKIPHASLRMSNNQKYKDNDFLLQSIETRNKSTILFFTNEQNVYTVNTFDLPNQKASNLGDYLGNIVGLDNDEKIIYMINTTEYDGHMIFGFKDGRLAKVPLTSYKSNRKKLQNCYYKGEDLLFIKHSIQDFDILMLRDDLKATVFNTSLVEPKSTKSTRGVKALGLKKDSYCSMITDTTEFNDFDLSYYTSNKLTTGGHFITDLDLNKKINDLLK